MCLFLYMYMHTTYLHIRIIYIYCSQTGCQRWGVHVCSSGGAQAELRPVQFASRPLGEWKLAAYVSHEPMFMAFMAHIPIGKKSAQWHCECHVNLYPHPLETSGILPLGLRSRLLFHGTCGGHQRQGWVFTWQRLRIVFFRWAGHLQSW